MNLEINFLLAFIWILGALLAQFFVIRKHVSSVLDPLVYFIFTTSFSVALAAAVVEDEYILVRVAAYLLFFWIGFLLACGSIFGRSSAKEEILFRRDAVFSVVMSVGVFLVLAGNLIAWQKTGVPIFSDDPSLQKSEALVGGLGIVRRLNWGVGTFLLMGAVFWSVFDRRRIAVFYLFVLAVVSILNGSKSALLPMVFALGLYLRRPFIGKNSASKVDWVRNLSKYALLLASLPVLMVFAIESGEVDGVFFALFNRLLYFGDVLLYWSNPGLRSHFMGNYPSLSYPSHLFGGVLGMLRLIPYPPPIGNEFVQFSLRAGQELSEALGPNVPFYVKGELFFGPIVACMYSALVGVLVGLFNKGFSQKMHPSLTRYTVSATLVAISLTLPTEDSLMVSRLFDFFVFFLPVFVFAKVFVLAARYRVAR